eukprot:5572694-Amphidinium_carterae.1
MASKGTVSAKKRKSDTLTLVRVVTYCTASMVRSTAVATRAISPDGANSIPSSNGWFKSDNAPANGRKQEPGPQDTSKSVHCIRQPRLTSGLLQT